jgi:hypothetical protein
MAQHVTALRCAALRCATLHIAQQCTAEHSTAQRSTSQIHSMYSSTTCCIGSKRCIHIHPGQYPHGTCPSKEHDMLSRAYVAQQAPTSAAEGQEGAVARTNHSGPALDTTLADPVPRLEASTDQN